MNDTVSPWLFFGFLGLLFVAAVVVLVNSGIETVQGTTFTDSGYTVYKHCIDGVMYYSASSNLAVAIDAETLKPIVCD